MKVKRILLCLSLCLIMWNLTGCEKTFQKATVPEKEEVADARKNRINEISADALQKTGKTYHSNALKAYQKALNSVGGHLYDTSYISTGDLKEMASIIKKDRMVQAVIGKRVGYLNTNLDQAMPSGQIESTKMLEFYGRLMRAAQSEAEIEKKIKSMESSMDTEDELVNENSQQINASTEEMVSDSFNAAESSLE